MEGEKKERPQNKNLKPLGSGLRTPEEELAIRRKGKEAADRSRKRNADIRSAVRAIANLSVSGRGKSKEVEKLSSVEQLNDEGAPLISHVVYAQFVLAKNGDKEARDWICRMLGIKDLDPDAVSPGVQSDAADEAEGGVRIHLIRGNKPETAESEEAEATRAAAQLATVEAMKAVSEALQKEHEERLAEVKPDDG